MPGGTAFYFSHALNKLNVDYLLVTALARQEMHYVDDLAKAGIAIKVQPSEHTVYFENIYAENQDERSQNVLQQADPFTMEQLLTVDAKIFHLGPLLANDFSTDFIRSLAAKGSISLDVQGYLRRVVDNTVYEATWKDKKEALHFVDIVKADVAELHALTGYDDVSRGARLLAEWGVKEVVITNGSNGSVIYHDGVMHDIPAYRPKTVVDTTGCGDTYMAGYLYKRVKNSGMEESGNFAAAMAGLKTETSGPFMGTEADIVKFMKTQDK